MMSLHTSDPLASALPLRCARAAPADSRGAVCPARAPRRSGAARPRMAATAAAAGRADDSAASGAEWSPELRALSARLAAERHVSHVAATLREGLTEAGSEFSYARARGLRALSAAVRPRGLVAAAAAASACARAHRRPHTARRWRRWPPASRTPQRCGRRALAACAMPCAPTRPLLRLQRAVLCRSQLLHGRLEVDILSLLLGRSLAEPPAAGGGEGGASGGGGGAGGAGEAADAAGAAAGGSLGGGGGAAAAPVPPAPPAPLTGAAAAVAAYGRPDAAEAAAAAQLLRGVCLLDARTRAAAAQLGGVELLLARAAGAAPGAAGAPLRAAALGALAALLADAPAAQAEFTRLRGAAAVAALASGGGGGGTDGSSSSSAAAAAPSPEAESFLALALASLLQGDALRAAEEAVRGALGGEAAARLRAIA